jgi:hypothetical protein
MQCVKPHIRIHEQYLKRAYAMHKITQGSINRLWIELVREYLMPPMYLEKHYPYSKLNVYDKKFVFPFLYEMGFHLCYKNTRSKITPFQGSHF